LRVDCYRNIFFLHGLSFLMDTTWYEYAISEGFKIFWAILN